ncbi:MAG TPA: MraY family glycosyltransferase, partial [Actinomycetota bacterium]|nr:MraY family glycosyltransferase [Actinomycetota bacterium]
MALNDTTRVWVAFSVALCLSWAIMPAAIALGRRWGLVVRPRLFNKGDGIVSILGGAALAIAASAGFLGAWGVPEGTGVFMLAALGLLVLGFLDDRSKSWLFNPSIRLVVQLAVAGGAYLSGLRSDTPGVLGAVISVLTLTACMNAFNLLDNMDGVAGSTGAAVGAGICMTALLGNQYMVAALAAAVCGGCLGFLRFNLRNARIYLGNGGSLFIGFILGAAALKLRTPLDFPWGPVAMVALLALPASDTAVVIISRLLAGRPVMLGGVDHISHRLVAVGYSKLTAALVHAGAALLAGLGVAGAIVTGSPEILVMVLIFFAAGGLLLLQLNMYDREAVEVPSGLLARVPATVPAIEPCVCRVRRAIC